MHEEEPPTPETTAVTGPEAGTNVTFHKVTPAARTQPAAALESESGGPANGESYRFKGPLPIGTESSSVLFLKRPRFRFSLFRLTLGAALLGALGVAASWTWVFLFYPPDAPFEPETFPEDGSVILERTPTFRWNSDDADGLFRIVDGKGQLVWERTTNTNSVTLADGLLRPSTTYRWQVFPGGMFTELSPVPVVDRAFTTAGELKLASPDGSLTVYPDQVSLSLRHLLESVPLEVVCTAGNLEVQLPDELAREQGARQYRAGPTGVQFHLKFDPNLAHESPEQWEPIKIRCGDIETGVPLSVSTTLGPFLGSFGVGFRPYHDTPSFANFSESTLAVLTDGTCVGIAFAVQLFFEKVSFGPDAKGRSVDMLSPLGVVEALLAGSEISFHNAVDFRDLTARRPQFVRDIMSTIHLENVNPANLTGTIKASLIQPGPQIAEAILDELEAGRVAVLAGFRLKTRVFKTGSDLASYAVMDGGHAFVVYRAWRFQSVTLFAVYDPNFRYENRAPLSTLLVVPREGRPAYYIDGVADRYMVRFMVMSSSDIAGLLGPLTQGVKQGVEGALDGLDQFFQAVGQGVSQWMPGL